MGVGNPRGGRAANGGQASKSGEETSTTSSERQCSAGAAMLQLVCE
jgi:hypothetical protein